MKVNKEKIEEEIKENFKERLRFITFWVEYIKTHNDENWSEQQNMLIDSQLD